MQHFQRTLYTWYQSEKRTLPWRETTDPYKIWLSEIILQQTRVSQGISYYNKFISQFPDVFTLANAPEDEVLKLWQGLGYYSRARNMHHTSKTIVNDYGGIFPNNYKTIERLKGIGPYTAAAISSIAFNLPHATIDGNVYRVLSRYFGIDTPIDSVAGKKQFHKLANELISGNNPGMHNQALMEFGALQCIPKNPDCVKCPLHQSCYAYTNKKVQKLPIKEKKVKQTKRFFYYYVLDDGQNIYLEKRTKNDIWKNLYQFPMIESKEAMSENELLTLEVPYLKNKPYNIVSVSAEKKHVLSHQILLARLIYLEINEYHTFPSSLIKVNKKDISKFAVPRLMEKFIETLNFK